MPFKSKAQRTFLYMHHPEVAKEFAAHTPKGAKLPHHVKDRKRTARKAYGTQDGQQN